MKIQELGPRVDHSGISLPDLSPLTTHWDKQFVTWIRKNGALASQEDIDAEAQKLVHKLNYIREVNALLTSRSIGLEDPKIILLSPLCNMLLQYRHQQHQQEELQPDGALESGSKIAVQEWLTIHPDSKPAQIVSLVGLSAAVGTHLKLLTEMCSEAQAEAQGEGA